ncbi:MAG: SulP family inorganic anion transporter [Alphaproteobacteria bacterium]|nr:SulP family inorganic anion transporter [Alphaproteobacteria bacterium]MBU2082533.1 SulP family inorganic anion transporter [Alphaproteobacteria bacterium]MBU2142827.1 SulP family inorganic anion transporter [Alphaproteobacteria bacterium]MBU2195249.1 SulP family inorganic anion transporter [Alphaproteobacteria bacterium]
MPPSQTGAQPNGAPYFDLSNLKGDLFGGLTAGIVALPLALAFGEASGAGPIAGLWGAIFVGFFAALFGGTGSQVSGPTGPMVVVFAGLYAALGGNPALVFGAVILAGVMQILFGLMRFGQYVKLVPYPVISGFMSGIGVIIIALQLARLFGHEPDGGGTIPAFTAVPDAVMNPNFLAVGIALLTLAIVFGWPKKFAAFVPGPLAALVIGTLASMAIPGAPLLGDIPTGFPSFVLPSVSVDSALIVIEAAFILAVLGSIDSLLTSLVADNMTRTRHQSNKELVGQGIGNALGGFFGAIPGAGATMRTVINIRSGGRTRISGMTHALVLLAIVISLGPLAAQIPHAVLAGILVKVGVDTIDFSYLKRAHKGPRWDLALMVLVLGLTVFVDLITAVAVGVVLAALAFIKNLADDQIQAVQEDEPRLSTEEETQILSRSGGRVMMFDFGGPLSFGAAADLGHHVRSKSGDKVEIIILDFSRVPFVDVSSVRAVETIVEDATDSGKQVYITGMNESVGRVLRQFATGLPGSEEKQFSTRLDALKTALTRLEPSRA